MRLSYSPKYMLTKIILLILLKNWYVTTRRHKQPTPHSLTRCTTGCGNKTNCVQVVTSVSIPWVQNFMIFKHFCWSLWFLTPLESKGLLYITKTMVLISCELQLSFSYMFTAHGNNELRISVRIWSIQEHSLKWEVTLTERVRILLLWQSLCERCFKNRL